MAEKKLLIATRTAAGSFKDQLKESFIISQKEIQLADDLFNSIFPTKVYIKTLQPFKHLKSHWWILFKVKELDSMNGPKPNGREPMTKMSSISSTISARAGLIN